MEVFLATLFGVIGLVVLLKMTLDSHFRKQSEMPADPVTPEEIVQFVDSSLKGYPDRIHRKDPYGADIWTCHSRLFTIQFGLEARNQKYFFQAHFFFKSPYRFKLQRSTTSDSLEIAKSFGKDTTALLAAKEIPALVGKLRFFDRVKVSTHGFTGTRTFLNLDDLADWPKTLGASITFVRFLLDHQKRGKISEKGEALCPYCKESISEQDKAVSCRECRTIHHQDCWNETDRCSVFGCGNKTELEL